LLLRIDRLALKLAMMELSSLGLRSKRVKEEEKENGGRLVK
jgi:hypothetical protein